jgi:hypothetical protein
MSNYISIGNISNPGVLILPHNVPGQRRGLSVRESEEAVRNACLAHALGTNNIVVNDSTSTTNRRVVIGAHGSNPIYVNNVGTMPRQSVTIMAPGVIHQRCGVPGCRENHAVHRCRRCNSVNLHTTSNCNFYCGIPGCNLVHRVHICQSCNQAGHRTRNCPNLSPRIVYINRPY